MRLVPLGSGSRGNSTFVELVDKELKRRRSNLVYNLIRSPLYNVFTHPVIATLAKHIPFIFPSIKSMLEYFASYHYFSP